jgi:hypothetical protein
MHNSFPFDINAIITLTVPPNISNYGALLFGDINSDSYPDLLTIATINSYKKVLFLLNTQSTG